jgi:predicted DNA binding protein
VISAQFRIELPEGTWVREVSRSFPQATFRLLTGRRSGDEAISLGEVVTDEPATVASEMREHRSITDYEQLAADDERVLARYTTTDTDLYQFAEMASVPVEFPVVVQNGWYEFDLTGTRAELDRLEATIEASGLAYELQSLVTADRTESLLTYRQRELLETAIREGYFEVPRECTLAELAETVGVDKSTASTVLRRGEATLVKAVLADPGRSGRPEP